MTGDSTPILVASDLSHRSDRAMARAFRIARDLGAPVVVLTVLDDAIPSDLVGDLHERSVAKLERYAESLSGGGVPFRVEAVLGDPTERILAVASTLEPRLLVMGVHRNRPFLGMLRETTMQRIVRFASVPVLLAVDRDDHEYDKVLAAIDFSPAATAALRLASTLAPDAEVTPFNAVHIPYAGMLAHTRASRTELERTYQADAEAADRAWRDTAAIAGLAPTEFVADHAYVALRRKAEEGGYDLISVGAHGRVGATRAILGSLAVELMRDPPCDVLVARP